MRYALILIAQAEQKGFSHIVSALFCVLFLIGLVGLAVLVLKGLDRIRSRSAGQSAYNFVLRSCGALFIGLPLLALGALLIYRGFLLFSLAKSLE